MDITRRGRTGIALLIALAIATAGCNTVKGVGKDTQKAGEAIERGAERHDLNAEAGT